MLHFYKELTLLMIKRVLYGRRTSHINNFGFCHLYTFGIQISCTTSVSAWNISGKVGVTMINDPETFRWTFNCYGWLNLIGLLYWNLYENFIESLCTRKIILFAGTVFYFAIFLYYVDCCNQIKTYLMLRNTLYNLERDRILFSLRLINKKVSW